MDDFLLCRFYQAATYLRGNVQSLGQSDCAFVDSLPKCFAFVVLHRNIESAVVGLADFMYRTNVGVIECGSGPGLDEEPFLCIRIGKQMIGGAL